MWTAAEKLSWYTWDFDLLRSAAEFTKVVENQTRKYLLSDELRPLGVKAGQANGILQIAEGCFYAPAQVIECLEFERRKQGSVQIGDEIFKEPGREFDGHNAEIQGIEARVMEIAEIEAARLWNNAIEIRVGLHLICLLFRQFDMERHVKRCVFRQSESAKDAVAAGILHADQETHPLFNNMRHDIVAFIAAIGGKNGLCIGGKTVDHCDERADLIRTSARLKDCVRIAFAAYVVKRVQVQKIIPARMIIGLEKGVCFQRIGGIVQSAAVTGDEPVAVDRFPARKRFADLREYECHRLRQQFGSLLNQCRYSWRIVAEMKAVQHLVRQRAAFHPNQHFGKPMKWQLPVP